MCILMQLVLQKLFCNNIIYNAAKYYKYLIILDHIATPVTCQITGPFKWPNYCVQCMCKQHKSVPHRRKKMMLLFMYLHSLFGLILITGVAVDRVAMFF